MSWMLEILFPVRVRFSGIVYSHLIGRVEPNNRIYLQHCLSQTDTITHPVLGCSYLCLVLASIEHRRPRFEMWIFKNES